MYPGYVGRDRRTGLSRAYGICAGYCLSLLGVRFPLIFKGFRGKSAAAAVISFFKHFPNVKAWACFVVEIVKAGPVKRLKSAAAVNPSGLNQ